MLDFRKVLLATVAGLGFISVASAQVVPTCTISNSAPTAYVAVEGTTEEVATLLLNCTNTGAFTGPFNLTLTANAPITNQTLTAAPHNLDISAIDSAADAVTSITQPAANQVLITFNTVTAAVTTFTVNGVRVNPSSNPVGSTITITPSSSTVQIAATPANWPAGFVSKTLSTVTIDGTGYVPGGGSVCGNTGTTAAPNTTTYNASNVGLTANFLDSLKSSGDATSAPPTSTFGTTNVNVAAKVGTVLAVTFNNLNAAGVNYYVPQTITAGNMTLTAYTALPTNLATAVPATATTAGTLTTNILTSFGTAYTAYNTAFTPNLTLATPTAAAALPLTGTSGTMYYAVSATTTTATEFAFISLVENVPVPTAVTSFSQTAVAASISIAGQASPAYPGISASASPYTATPTSASSGLLTACSTTLLFPYVVNTAGFDTGIVITNASGIAVGGTATAATTGSCTVTFYGTGAATSPGNTYSTGTLTSAQNNTFATSSAQPGLNGYAVATCNFLGAHGYAFLFSGAGTPAAYAADYLAVITSSGAVAAAANLSILN